MNFQERFVRSMRFRSYYASFPLIPAFSLSEKENWVPSLVQIGAPGGR